MAGRRPFVKLLPLLVNNPAGRLTEVKKNGIAIESYAYDSNGNRLTFTDGTVSPAVTVSGTYDDQDRMLTYGDLQFIYSKSRELGTKTNPTLSQTAGLSYDVLGNLKSVTLPNSDLIEYVIDGQNRRIGKKVNGTLVQGFLEKGTFYFFDCHSPVRSARLLQCHGPRAHLSEGCVTTSSIGAMPERRCFIRPRTIRRFARF